MTIDVTRQGKQVYWTLSPEKSEVKVYHPPMEAPSPFCFAPEHHSTLHEFSLECWATVCIWCHPQFANVHGHIILSWLPEHKREAVLVLLQERGKSMEDLSILPTSAHLPDPIPLAHNTNTSSTPHSRKEGNV